MSDGSPRQLFSTVVTSTAHSISGLHYLSDFLDEESQQRVLTEIDCPTAPWIYDLERRVQHYGWRYDYQARAITRDMRIGPLPTWLSEMASRLMRTGLFEKLPDQAIVNEYEPGQGIAMHADRQGFGPTVAMVSLNDSWYMDLRPVKTGSSENRSILLEKGSALVLTGEARQHWMHGIAKRKRERHLGGWVTRKRRVSVTFRTVLRNREFSAERNSR